MDSILIVVVIVMLVCIMVITPQGRTTITTLKNMYCVVYGTQKIERGIAVYRMVKKCRVPLNMYETPCVLVGRNAAKKMSFSGKEIPSYDISGFFGPSVDDNAILVTCTEEQGKLVWHVRECNTQNATLIGETKSGEWVDSESYSFTKEANFKIGKKSLACIQGILPDENENNTKKQSTKEKTRGRAINL